MLDKVQRDEIKAAADDRMVARDLDRLGFDRGSQAARDLRGVALTEGLDVVALGKKAASLADPLGDHPAAHVRRAVELMKGVAGGD